MAPFGQGQVGSVKIGKYGLDCNAHLFLLKVKRAPLYLMIGLSLVGSSHRNAPQTSIGRWILAQNFYKLKDTVAAAPFHE